jgi:diguanylate cyclase (GGDEF)-like protein
MDNINYFLPKDLQLRVCTAAADKVGVGLAIVDSQSRIVFWNQWLKEKSGLDFEAAATCGFFDKFPDLKDTRFALAMETAIKYGLPSLLSQSLNKAPLPLFENLIIRGERIQQAIRVTPLELQGEARFCLIQVNDVSIAVKKERLLREQAEILRGMVFVDVLTGLANRRHFNECLETEFKRGARADSPLSIIIMDVDYFKQFNDLYGHQNGDFCLQRVANAIKSRLLRPADLAARYGGEEFVIVLPDTPMNGALNLAEEIRHYVESLAIAHAGSKVSEFVTLSLGLSSATNYSLISEKTLLVQADNALYQAKAGGRNRVVAFSV